MSNPTARVTGQVARAQQDNSVVDLNELKLSALRGLVRMFDPAAQMFCHRLNWTGQGFVPEGRSHRYTIMTLLGLYRAENAGLKSPIDTQPVLDRLLTETSWIDNSGDLGLLIWLCAETAPHRLREIFSRFDVLGSLDHFRDAKERRTMELAWCLTGLSITKQAQASGIPNVTDLAARTFRLVKENQGNSGTFGHLAKPSRITERVRYRIGSFADQVYSILAFARFADVFGSEEALISAKQCAEEICRLQGPLGQWWWHYDSGTGRLAGKYPVFSVHQHGMAPMALFAIGEVAGLDFTSPIYKGLHWIAGCNELNSDLRVSGESIIWRSIYQRQYVAYYNEVSAIVGLPRTLNGLRLRTECRPYELGWLLYAFATRGQ